MVYGIWITLYLWKQVSNMLHVVQYNQKYLDLTCFSSTHFDRLKNGSQDY